MELEFDKEIDAILRKARPNKGVLVGDSPPDKPEPKKHLDADAIVAFAENALPDKAKLLYTEHFADCDRCRKQLAFQMHMNTEVEVSAASRIPASEVVTSIPWYQSFLKAPNLALAFGAMVLVFSGVLGYLVIKKQSVPDSATVSQVKEPDRDPQIFNRQSETSNAAPANVMTPADIAPAANTSANSATTMSGRGPDTGLDMLGRTDADPTKPDVARENSFIMDGQEVTEAKAGEKAAAPPPPVTTDSTSSGIAMERDEKQPVDDGKFKEESKDLELAKKRSADDRGYRDMPRAASKVGPSRGVGPVQNQSNQIYNKNYDMPVTRVVGGKTFNNRDGAWYDSAYQGQATTNYRRGTAEYKKLDSGLRNIANTIGGTVVIMWKSKAYRIQ